MKTVSAPDTLPPLREVIAAHDLKALKKFGQNFLLDGNITNKIARSAGNLSEATVIEIGPGPGGLTRSLLQAGAKKVMAIELDERAVRALEDLKEYFPGQLEVIHGDALKMNLTSLAPRPRILVANLPYNIATPLLVNWLKQIRNIPDAYQTMTLMFQKEVAQRLTAKPGGKTYGRLSVLTQWLCEVEKVFDLPPSVFTPPPKVTSSVVRFTPRKLEDAHPAFESVEALTAAAFGQRRKMIRTSLKDYQPQLAKLNIDLTKRAEDLTVENFVKISNLT